MENHSLRDLLVVPESPNRSWFQQRGRTFERVLNKMLLKEEMEPRTSMRPEGEEIDGSFAIDNSFYLLEAKWHDSPIPASALYSFKGKVDGKLVGTIGVVFSMSDYSTEAVDALLKGKELNLVLFGHTDLLLIEDGKIAMRHAMRVKLRYAANYGQPFYPLETYLLDTQQTSVNAGKTQTQTQTQNQQWSILVEGEEDVRTIQLLLERFKIDAQFNVIAAGGQLAVAQLAEYVIKNSSMRLAVIITPFTDSKIQQEHMKRLNDIGADLIVLKQDIEVWLANYVSAEYFNGTMMLTNRNGKMARRYARNADIKELLSKNPSFSDLMLKLGAQPKQQ